MKGVRRTKPAMTVGDLRSKLADLPSDALVWIAGQDSGYYDEPEETEARSIEVLHLYNTPKANKVVISGYD